MSIENKIHWEKLIGDHSARSIAIHSFSNKPLKDYALFLNALLQTKSAAAKANVKEGIISEEVGAAIEKAAKELSDDGWAAFGVDVLQGGGAIAINMNVNETIARLAEVDADQVNASQSTADVCATSIRVALLYLWPELDEYLTQTAKLFSQKAKEFKDIPAFGRAGAPAYLGDTFGAFSEVCARRKLALENAVLELSNVSLGNTALDELGKLSGLSLKRRANLYDAAQYADDLGALAHELKLLCQCLIKISKDLRLLSSGPTGGEILLPSVVSDHSVGDNTTVVETLLLCAFQILGSVRVVEATLEHAELSLNVFETAAGINLYEAIEMLGSALKNFNRFCLIGITVPEAKDG